MFKADLTVEGSFHQAIQGVDGVFHTASPVAVHVMASVHLGSGVAVHPSSAGELFVNLTGLTACDLQPDFPPLRLSSKVSLNPTSSPLGPSRVSPPEQIAVENLDHSNPGAPSSSLMRQITDLNVENNRLKLLLARSCQSTELGATPSWKSVVVSDKNVSGVVDKESSTPNAGRMKLEFFPPTVENNRIVVSPSEQIEQLGQSKWEKCIVGHFLDKKLGFTAVRNIAMNIWDKFGIREVFSNEKGFFFFLFEGDKFRQILEIGHWHFGGKLLILKMWHPHLKMEKEQLSRIPIWVHFYNVPLEFWTGPGLSHIASSVGCPLYADQLTEAGKRLSFAKVCVEVDCFSTLPDSFDLKYANGDVVVIRIQYPWRPQVCTDCKVFGHGTTNCPKRVGVSKFGAGEANGRIGKSQSWQVVGSLRQDPGTGTGVLSSLGHLPSALASTSDPCGLTTSDPIVVGELGQQGSGVEFVIPGGGVLGLSPRKVSSDVNRTSPKSGPNRFEILTSATGDDTKLQGSVRRFELVGKISPDELPAALFDEHLVGNASVSADIDSEVVIVPQQVSTSPPNLGDKRLSLCGVLEAKARKENLDAIRVRCFPNSWLMLENSGVQGIARIILGWDPNSLDVSLLYSSAQLLCVQLIFICLLMLQTTLIDPCIKGTQNVLSSCTKASSVRRVVLTSSCSSIRYRNDVQQVSPLNESHWSDLEYCKRYNLWYAFAKTMAEKEAWKIAEKTGLDLVAVNPSYVVGPLLAPQPTSSLQLLLAVVKGLRGEYPNMTIGFVHIEDVVAAHILAMEESKASGRLICSNSVAHWSEIIDMLRAKYPSYPFEDRLDMNIFKVHSSIS
ncbi:hypothetical protein RHSIM_Rhsim12G0084200 [Rhododendron simsii]|uniref:Dihydroflavonol 4-reductase n=1 Tax=Rhododendron simsii TaxID=118357 RepID=A0A834L6H3_RHOSS|nr:hypothetical protein RHSIM_Rhsim12G0084200 [Rhododendron simsii]